MVDGVVPPGGSAMTNATAMEWALFNVGLCAVLLLDLLVASDGATARGSTTAARWTAVWVAISLLFDLHLYFKYGSEISINFLTGYIIEESLSLDNLFVILLTFGSFKIKKADQHKVLFWGILSAIILRGGCIFAGLALIERFSWMLQGFGLILLVAVFRILTEEEDEDSDQLAGGDCEGGDEGSSAGMKSNGLMLRLIRLVFRVSEEEGSQGRFFIRDGGGRLCATPLLVALIVVEGSDIIFAADSIPAIFGVTTDPYIVYTSNMCAIMGLRSLYFILADVLEQFSDIKYGLAAVLGFVAVKIIIAPWVHIGAGMSLLVIFAILAATALFGGFASDGALGPKSPGEGRDKPKVSTRALVQYGSVLDSSMKARRARSR